MSSYLIVVNLYLLEQDKIYLFLGWKQAVIADNTKFADYEKALNDIDIPKSYSNDLCQKALDYYRKCKINLKLAVFLRLHVPL